MSTDSASSASSWVDRDQVADLARTYQRIVDAAPAHYPARWFRALLVATGVVGGLLLLALVQALWSPGNPDLLTQRTSHGTSVITWVAPNGPAWNANFVPGDILIGQAAGTYTGSALVATTPSGTRNVLLPRVLLPTMHDILVSMLGLALLLFSAVVICRGRSRSTPVIWCLLLTTSLALGLVPAGRHGVLWAVALNAITIHLFGPLLLEVCLSVAAPEAESDTFWRTRHTWIWLPTGAYLLLYLFCWYRPYPSFLLLQVAGPALLVAYYGVASVWLVCALRHARTPQHKAQLQWLTIGLIGGMTPFILFSLLPLLVVGQSWLSAELTILVLLLAPVCISVGIARCEFLEMTTLVRRRVLHALLYALLVGGIVATVYWVGDYGTRNWHWSATAVAVFASILTMLGFSVLLPPVLRTCERFLLHEVSDSTQSLCNLIHELAVSSDQDFEIITVTRTRRLMNASAVLLLTSQGCWDSTRVASEQREELCQALRQHATSLLQQGNCQQPYAQGRLQDQPLLALPLPDRQTVQGVLCVGPRRSKEAYTVRDQLLLSLLGQYLTLHFARQHMLSVASEQHALLELLQHERAEQQVRLQALQHEATEQHARLASLESEGEPLSAREMELLPLLAQGLETKQMARALSLHTRSIEKRLTSIYRKWGVANRREAVHKALRLGLVTLTSSFESNS